MVVRRQKEKEWEEAKKRCRLSDEEVRMAKRLGIGPRSLIKNIPAPRQRWKLPVKEWLRKLYADKFGERKSRPEASEKSESPRNMRDVSALSRCLDE
jgi:hypothetical protein